MEQYRFKTEEEFIKQYGVNWIHYTNFNTDGFMNYLLGTKIPEDFQNPARLGRNFTIQNNNPIIASDRTWSIEKDMYVKIKPTYKNGVMKVKNGLLMKN